MTPFSFSTISGPSQGVYKEKGSKFLAFAVPVASEAEAKDQIQRLKKEYFDARHHGYAYVLGPGKEKFRAFDDGEPNHSTGDPILGQIRCRDLTNTLIVVVRYFGGVKLGVGGLASAYKTAAELALQNATVVEVAVTRQLDLHFDYDAIPKVMSMVKEYDLKILHQEFKDRSHLKVEVTLRSYDSVLKRLKLLQAMGVKLDVDI